MKKVLKVIKGIIIGIIGVIFSLFAIGMTVLLFSYNDYGVTEFGDKSLIMINDEIASETFLKGDLVITEKKKVDELVVGDQIFVYQVDTQGNVTIDLGTVGEIYEEDESVAFENGDTYAMEFVAGTSYKTYPKIGGYLSIIESRIGFLFMVLVPSFVVFIYSLYSLIVEIKYGAPEEEN